MSGLEAYLASRDYYEHVAGVGNDVRTEFGDTCAYRCYRLAVLYRTTHPITDACLTVHCWIHDVDEFETPTTYRVCFECKHVYQAEQELVDAYNRVVTEMNASGKGEEPISLRASAEEIYFCQLCMHDF